MAAVDFVSGAVHSCALASKPALPPTSKPALLRLFYLGANKRGSEPPSAARSIALSIRSPTGTGKPLSGISVHGGEVFAFQIGELFEDLGLGHSAGEILQNVLYGDAQFADTRLP